MRSKLAISFCVSAALLLAGCGADSVEGAAQAGESAVASSPTTTTVSAPDVCSGKQDCVTLAVVDVDGDGKDDSIGRAGGQIVVLTGSGIEAAVAGTDSKLLTEPKVQDAAGFVGAWDVDGMPGAEVVVATKELGGSGSYKVWAWVDANLAGM